MITKLLYLEDMCRLNCDAHVLQIIPEDNFNKIVVEQTVFYPQGGGQPSDKGIISNNNVIFCVESVFNENGTIFHKGIFTQGYHFNIGDVVELEVNAELRNLHNRNHTAGHLVDYALFNLGYNLISHKAYHFPQGPYVEYQGTLEQDEREQLQSKLEIAVNELAQQALSVNIMLVDNDPKKRVMMISSYPPILCGGTHVLNTKDIGHISIRKIKNEKGNLRVSYAVV